jgi:RNA recognition motif-containing protein
MKNIFVGNLTPHTTADSIRTLFEPHGQIGRVKLMVDRETGQSRGFAFIEMVDVAAGQAIAALNGHSVDGQAINVREGRPRLHAAGR